MGQTLSVWHFFHFPRFSQYSTSACLHQRTLTLHLHSNTQQETQNTSKNHTRTSMQTGRQLTCSCTLTITGFANLSQKCLTKTDNSFVQCTDAEMLWEEAVWHRRRRCGTGGGGVAQEEAAVWHRTWLNFYNLMVT